VNGARKGQPWGTFSFERSVSSGRNGPSYEEEEEDRAGAGGEGGDAVGHEYASKVSVVGDPSRALVVGRLRFRPDCMEPTSLK
jgi:hypothetical protein